MGLSTEVGEITREDAESACVRTVRGESHPQRTRFGSEEVGVDMRDGVWHTSPAVARVIGPAVRDWHQVGSVKNLSDVELHSAHSGPYRMNTPKWNAGLPSPLGVRAIRLG